MNKSLQVLLVNENVRLISCKILPPTESGKAPTDNSVASYTYKTMDQTLKVGDTIVVPVNAPNLDGDVFRVAKVVLVDIAADFDCPIKYKWVVAQLSFENYNNIIEAEKDVLEEISKATKLAKREELRANLLAHVKDVKSIKFLS